MRYVKNTMGIAEKQRLEAAGLDIALQADVQQRQAAKLDYIAMMAEIDLSDIEDLDSPFGDEPGPDTEEADADEQNV